MMDFRQLEMFRAVAEQGTFTRAAERLRVSQSAVSRQVQLLERELGGMLLHRTGKGVALTDAGEVLLKTTHRVDRELQDAVAQISATHALQRGTLQVAGGMTVCLYVLPRVLRKYKALHPGVDFHVTTGATKDILGLIRSREVDVALLTLPVVARDLEVVPVLSEEMVVVTAPGHPLTAERTVAPAALAGFPLVLYESGSNTRRVLDQFFLEEEVPVKVAMETENVEILKAMVTSGLGVTIVPWTPVAQDVRAGRLAYARIRGRKLVRETGWVYLATEHQPRALTELLRVFDEMSQAFRSGPAAGRARSVS